MHLCFLHLCRHFGEPCGAAVCVVFCVYCLHGAQKRLFTHLFVSLAFRAWLWHDLDVCYLMHVRLPRWQIFDCTVNKRAGVFCCWICLNSFGVDSVMWRGTHFLFKHKSCMTSFLWFWAFLFSCWNKILTADSGDVQVTIACDAVLNAPSAYKKQEPESWEEEIQVSRHARSLRQLDNGVRIPPRSEWSLCYSLCAVSTNNNNNSST